MAEPEEAKRNRKTILDHDLWVRIRSACFMLPLVIFLWLGGLPLLALITLCAAIALYEFYSGYEHAGIKPMRAVGYLSLALYVALCLLCYYNGYEALPLEDRSISFYQLQSAWLFLTLLFAFTGLLFSKSEEGRVESAETGAAGPLYIVFLLFHIFFLRCLPGGNLYIWLPFVISVGTDVTAYFAGRLLGKSTRKMAPTISPNKTMAGFFGGMAGGTVFCLLFSLLFSPKNLLHFTLMGFLGSFFSQGGDLVESALKRRWGVKDSGRLIPGHGGILDRLDSTMFTGPFVYYYLIFAKGI